MENTENIGPPNQTEPVRTPENLPQTGWLTVDEAVILCSENGLSRTPKTLRKWAERSFQKDDAEIIVHREDTMWAYRWKFEKTSLLRKIEQEVSLTGANASELVRTGADAGSYANEQQNSSSHSTHQRNHSEPVRTGAGEVVKIDLANSDEHGSNETEPVRTGSNQVEDVTVVLEEVRERLADKNKEVEFLRGQLEIAQAEAGRRATSTDEALKTIDRVVHSFELQAEANRALALRDAGGASPTSDSKPIRFAPEGIQPETAEPQQRDRDYQQPNSYVG